MNYMEDESSVISTVIKTKKREDNTSVSSTIIIIKKRGGLENGKNL